ncbi:TPA: Rop family plasmid primer RNA-binding protein, partial [Escherichia coli]|nr:Rop family plasmid primer RNA-binding protein [Escherichia coli]
IKSQCLPLLEKLDADDVNATMCERLYEMAEEQYSANATIFDHYVLYHWC